MGDRQKPLIMRQSIRVMQLLTHRDKFVFWALVALRFIVNLLDILGIALMAISVNFLVASPGTKTPLSPFFEALGLAVDARGSKLPALFSMGLLVVGVFILKAGASLALLSKSANQISALEVRYAIHWMRVLTDSQGRFNALPLRDSISYAVTAGAYSIFQRTLIAVSTVVAESAGLLATFAVLCVVQPVMTIGILIYFGGIAWILQSYVGERARRHAEAHTHSHVETIRAVRESIENEKILFLSGKKPYFTDKFARFKTLSSRSQARTTFLNNFPRYVVETSLIVGAFFLAGAAFVLQAPLAAATTLTFFLTAATRMTPALLNVMGALSVVSAAESDTDHTAKLLQRVGLKLEAEN